MGGRSLAEEEWPDVALEEVCGDVFCDHHLVGFEGFKIARTHLRRYLEADVQELAEAGIVGGVGLIVAQGSGELSAGPGVDGFRCGQLLVVDINDVGIRRAELVSVCVGLGVDLFGECEARAAGLGEPDELFKPGGACGLQMDAGAGFCDRLVDGGVDGELVRAGVDAELQIRGQAVGVDRRRRWRRGLR